MLRIKDDILKQTPLAEGGEGFIYNFDKNHVLKIYKDHVNKEEKFKKIGLLMQKTLPKSVVAPEEIVLNKKGQFIGYMMRKVEGEVLKMISSNKFIKVNHISIKVILKLLTDIKDTLKELHRNHIFISDFNDYNILFDSKYNVYFIDVDSWTVEGLRCDVCMDLFRDPLLMQNNFSVDTDNYAFSILLFKSLTRLHPFGGTTEPDLDILERMQKRISVLGDVKVIVPKTINNWNFIPLVILDEMKAVFEGDRRILIDDSLNEFNNHLAYCIKDKEYYYSRYDKCPLCYDNVTVVQVLTNDQSDLRKVELIFSDKEVRQILSIESYIDISGFVTHRKTGRKVHYIFGNRYYFCNDNSVLYISNDEGFKAECFGAEYSFDKLYKSRILVMDTRVYYITRSHTLVELNITEKGNFAYNLAKVSNNSIFDVYDKENFFVCNMYDKQKVIHISGYNFNLLNEEIIINYGIHLDKNTEHWLFIIETGNGKFYTYIFDKNNLVYQSDTRRYVNSLGNLCFSNGVIFESIDKAIRGFNYQKGVYKDFSCDVATEESKLYKDGGKFTIENEREIYSFG